MWIRKIGASPYAVVVTAVNFGAWSGRSTRRHGGSNKRRPAHAPPPICPPPPRTRVASLIVGGGRGAAPPLRRGSRPRRIQSWGSCALTPRGGPRLPLRGHAVGPPLALELCHGSSPSNIMWRNEWRWVQAKHYPDLLLLLCIFFFFSRSEIRFASPTASRLARPRHRLQQHRLPHLLRRCNWRGLQRNWNACLCRASSFARPSMSARLATIDREAPPLTSPSSFLPRTSSA
jgi:hypothetical protein